MLVVGLNKPLHPDPLGDDGAKVAHGILLPFLEVILRDELANGDAAVHAQVEQHGVEHGPADILEVDFNPVGEAPLEHGDEVGLLLVVESVMEPELGLVELHLLLGPSGADNIAPGEARELAHQLADSAGGPWPTMYLVRHLRWSLNPLIRRLQAQATASASGGRQQACSTAVTSGAGMGCSGLRARATARAAAAPSASSWTRVSEGK